MDVTPPRQVIKNKYSNRFSSNFVSPLPELSSRPINTSQDVHIFNFCSQFPKKRPLNHDSKYAFYPLGHDSFVNNTIPTILKGNSAFFSCTEAPITRSESSVLQTARFIYGTPVLPIRTTSVARFRRKSPQFQRSVRIPRDRPPPRYSTASWRCAFGSLIQTAKKTQVPKTRVAVTDPTIYKVSVDKNSNTDLQLTPNRGSTPLFQPGIDNLSYSKSVLPGQPFSNANVASEVTGADEYKNKITCKTENTTKDIATSKSFDLLKTSVSETPLSTSPVQSFVDCTFILGASPANYVPKDEHCFVSTSEAILQLNSELYPGSMPKLSKAVSNYVFAAQCLRQKRQLLREAAGALHDFICKRVVFLDLAVEETFKRQRLVTRYYRVILSWISMYLCQYSWQRQSSDEIHKKSWSQIEKWLHEMRQRMLCCNEGKWVGYCRTLFIDSVSSDRMLESTENNLLSCDQALINTNISRSSHHNLDGSFSQRIFDVPVHFNSDSKFKQDEDFRTSRALSFSPISKDYGNSSHSAVSQETEKKHLTESFFSPPAHLKSALKQNSASLNETIKGDIYPFSIELPFERKHTNYIYPFNDKALSFSSPRTASERTADAGILQKSSRGNLFVTSHYHSGKTETITNLGSSKRVQFLYPEQGILDSSWVNSSVRAQTAGPELCRKWERRKFEVDIYNSASHSLLKIKRRPIEAQDWGANTVMERIAILRENLKHS